MLAKLADKGGPLPEKGVLIKKRGARIMKRFFYALMLVILVPAFSQSQNIKKGDVARVPEWAWVEVMNPEPVQNNYNIGFSFKEKCGVDSGGVIQVIGIKGDSLLVRYILKRSATGSMCPSGTLYFVSKKEFITMTARYKKNTDKTVKERKAVEKLLNNK
jgi:hypothetical protein